MKQKTPHDQLIAVTSSLEGNLSNFKHGIISDETFIMRAEEIIAQFKRVIPHTLAAEWHGAIPDVPLPRPAKTGFEDTTD